jgi:4-amino-4-deoxy-L-arabinose transferase-like glycosyltransferase
MNLSPPLPPSTFTLVKPRWRWGSPCRRGAFWFLMGVVVCCAVGDVFWLSRHWLTIPPPWDQAFYLYMGLRYMHALADGCPAALIREFIRLSPDVAPLFPLTTLPLYLLFGISRLAAYLTNVFYLTLLVLAVYALGAFVYSRSTGLLAVFVVTTFTATVNYSRDYLLEFPSAAFIALGMYALIRSEAFRQRRWCIAFGALAGLAVLTKTMGGVFFVGPVLYAFGCLIRHRQLTSAHLLNSLVAVGVGVLTASIWWVPNFRTAVGYLVYYGFRAGSEPYSKGGSDILTLQNLGYYALALMNYGTSFLYALLFACLMLFRGVRAVLRLDEGASAKVKAVRQESMLWVWLLMGYALLTLVPNKGEERYAQALLPPIALLLSGAVDCLLRRWWKRAVVALIALIGGVNYLGLTYELPLIPRKLELHPIALISLEYPHYSWVRSKIHPAADSPWPISDILTLLSTRASEHRARTVATLRSQFLDPMRQGSIEEDTHLIYRVMLGREPDRRRFQQYLAALRGGRLTRAGLMDTLMAFGEFRNHRARVLVVPDHPLFNASTLRYYAELDRLPLSFAHILDGPIDAGRLQEYAFVLVKHGGYQGPEFSTRLNDAIQSQLQLPDAGFFPLPRSFSFPDHSHIVIYVAGSVLN